MSITSDIRGYADTAIEQGRQVLEQAQSQLNDVTGQANEIVGKLTGTARENVTQLGDRAGDLRAQAEKAINLEAIKAAVEPYLAQARDYRHSVTDRAESLIKTAKKDPRVAKAFQTAESVTGIVVDTVQERVVKPVQSLARRGGSASGKPAKSAAAKSTSRPAAKSAAATKSASKPATTRSANKTTAKAPARKSTARKSAAKKSTSSDAKA